MTHWYGMREVKWCPVYMRNEIVPKCHVLCFGVKSKELMTSEFCKENVNQGPPEIVFAL